VLVLFRFVAGVVVVAFLSPIEASVAKRGGRFSRPYIDALEQLGDIMLSLSGAFNVALDNETRTSRIAVACLGLIPDGHTTFEVSLLQLFMVLEALRMLGRWMEDDPWTPARPMPEFLAACVAFFEAQQGIDPSPPYRGLLTELLGELRAGALTSTVLDSRQRYCALQVTLRDVHLIAARSGVSGYAASSHYELLHRMWENAAKLSAFQLTSPATELPELVLAAAHQHMQTIEDLLAVKIWMQVRASGCLLRYPTLEL